MSTLSLRLVKDNGPTTRGLVASDQQRVFSVYDFLTYTCGFKGNGNSARKAFYQLIRPDSKHKSRVEKLVYRVQFPGSGQRTTPAMTAEGLQMLLMIVEARVARAFRDETFNVLQRYIDGDMSLCKEVKENKALGKSKSRDKFMEKVMEKTQESMDEESLLMPSPSFIYAVKSPAFPGLIKIGRTQDIVSRLSNLNTACAPAPFVIVALAYSFDTVRDERAAHAFFAHARKEGEFFELEDSEAITYFAKINQDSSLASQTLV